MTLSGYALIMSSVVCFISIVFIKLKISLTGVPPVRYESWLEFVQSEATTIGLIIIAVVAASLGRSLLRIVHLADARTIPREDLPLIEQAVKDGKPEPVDQYVRLRSLSGMSGTFTKLGITGLPLTTVLLTLIFSIIALFPFEQAASFLDLAKLTLGAFIGSFVQRGVEQRRIQTSQNSEEQARSDLPV